MKRMPLVIFFLFILLPGLCLAEISTSDLANGAQKGQDLFDSLLLERDKFIKAIELDSSLGPNQKARSIRKLQKEFLVESRKIHLKYREPFIQRVIAETNKDLPSGSRVKPSLGSSIYLRDEKTGKVLKDSKGRKIINRKHRGMAGDTDLSCTAKSCSRLKKQFAKYSVETRGSPGYIDLDEVEITANIGGSEFGKPGSSTHQTGARIDAWSKETYVSFGMDENQAGRSLVETNDHTKKAIAGFRREPAELLGSGGEKTLQNVAKGTLKSIDSGKVTSDQLKNIMVKSGLNDDPRRFKKVLEFLKTGHLDTGVGLNEDNIKAFQKASRLVTEQALENAQKQYSADKVKTQELITEHEQKIKSGELSEAELNNRKKTVNQLRNDLIDSKVKIEETASANKAKFEGRPFGSSTPGSSTPVKPKKSLVNIVKGGLPYVPGALEVAGVALSAWNLWDIEKKLENGQITRNEGIIGRTKEAVDVSMGLLGGATPLAAGGIGSGTLGAVATVGVPLVVIGGASYLVSEAAAEGLGWQAALKREDINNRIAKSTALTVRNKSLLRAETLLKALEGSGNADSDTVMELYDEIANIADRLERNSRLTGNKDYETASDDIYDKLWGADVGKRGDRTSPEFTAWEEENKRRKAKKVGTGECDCPRYAYRYKERSTGKYKVAWLCPIIDTISEKSLCKDRDSTWVAPTEQHSSLQSNYGCVEDTINMASLIDPAVAGKEVEVEIPQPGCAEGATFSETTVAAEEQEEAETKVLTEAETTVAPPSTVATEVSDDLAEVAFWDAIKDSDDPDMLEAYLAEYPEGAFEKLVKLKLKKLDEKTAKEALAQDEIETAAEEKTTEEEAAEEALAIEAAAIAAEEQEEASCPEGTKQTSEGCEKLSIAEAAAEEALAIEAAAIAAEEAAKEKAAKEKAAKEKAAKEKAAKDKAAKEKAAKEKAAKEKAAKEKAAKEKAAKEKAANEASMTGSWSGRWRSSTGVGGRVAGKFVQKGDTFSGPLTIGGSPCFGNETAKGAVSGSKAKFGNVGNGITFSGSVKGSTLSGTYKVSNTASGKAHVCAGDSGTYSLKRK